MKLKKTAAAIFAAVMLFALAACGRTRHVIPVSELEFGMTREQVNALIDGEPDITGDDHDIYLEIPSDLDARLNSCIFNYNGAGRLFALYIESDYAEETDAEKLREDITEKLNALYGFSEDGWTFGEEKNSFTYVDIDRKISLMTRVNSYDEGFNASVTFMSGDHSEDENAENFPVIPKN
ncbi:MAG: hypothetical protein NC253_15070 [Ruminococcus sp.]|nr:hypothetical protein [Ruminococcus sp.]MCM1480559.1 hypothetical protein [Muribaculaceae bacterium]